MTTEYGIFSDEGLVEGGFFTRLDAETAAHVKYDLDGVTVHEICPDHEDQPADACEDCDDPDDDESEDEDDEDDEGDE